MKNIEVLEDKHYQTAIDIYNDQKIFYPLIGAVLEKKQDGVVLTDSNLKPSVFFVIHKMGFSFYYELKHVDRFDKMFFDFIVDTQNNFLPHKIRWYSPPGKWILKLRKLDSPAVQESARAQFRLSKDTVLNRRQIEHSFTLTQRIDKNMFDMLEKQFQLDLASRFWANIDDFLKNSFGFVLKYKGAFVSICYAATISNGIAEIDIATQKEYRNRGFGKISATSFVGECLKKQIVPNWDCYLNNAPSYKLSASLDFNLIKKYPLFTIVRN